MYVLGLLGELVCRDREVERPLPPAGKPLEPAQHPENLSARAFVTTPGSLRLEHFEDGTRPHHFTNAQLESGKRVPGALEVLAREPETLLDLRTPLQQALGELGCTVLRDPHARDQLGEQTRVAHSLGPLQCVSRVGKRRADIALKQVPPTPLAEDSRGASVVARCLRKRLVTELHGHRGFGVGRQRKRKENVGPLGAWVSLCEQLLE